MEKKTSTSSTSSTPRRTCACGVRMSAIKHDPHGLCASCIGFQCSLERRCTECKDWSAEVMNKYLKHQSSLLSKRESKRRKLERSQSAEGTVES